MRILIFLFVVGLLGCDTSKELSPSISNVGSNTTSGINSVKEYFRCDTITGKEVLVRFGSKGRECFEFDGGNFVIRSCDNIGICSDFSKEICYELQDTCLLYTSPSPRDQRGSRMPSSA